MASGAERDEGPKLEIFDGSDPSSYRAWKHRAKLMIAGLLGLLSTVTSAKFGARLMEFIKGEVRSCHLWVCHLHILHHAHQVVLLVLAHHTTHG